MVTLHGIINGVKAFFSGGQDIGTAIPSWEVGQIQYTDWNIDTAIKEAYKANAYVFRCIDIKAKAVGGIDWLTKSGTGSKMKVIDNHKMTQILSHPNDLYGGDVLRMFMVMDLDLGGNHYWYTGEKDKIYRLRQERVQIVPNDKGIEYYLYTIGSEEYKIPPEFIVHFKYPSPNDDYYGMAPILPGGRIIDIDNSALKSGHASFANQARPSGILTTDQILTEQQFNNVKDKILRSIQGVENTKSVPMMSGGFKFQQVSLSPQELDYILTLGMTGRGIHVVLGIQPESTGFVPSTFTNKKEAEITNWSQTIIPLLKLIKNTINLHYAPSFGDVYADFDISNTPAVLEARKERSLEAKNYFAMGVPFNVINTELSLGFDPVDGGDTGYLPLNLVPVGENYDTTDDTTTKIYTKAINLNTAKKTQRYIRQVTRLREAWYKASEKQIKKVFNAEKKLVLAKVNTGNYGVDKIVDKSKTAWEKTLKATWRGTFDDFAELINADLEKQKSFYNIKADDPWTKEIEKFVDSVVGDHIIKITKTTKERIRKQIADGLQEDETTAQIYKRIDNLYEDSMTPYRSYTIARTEVGSASGFASNTTAKASGIIGEKEWIGWGDDRERDIHLDMNGERVKLNEKYSNGLEYPGDPSTGEAEQVVMCRCMEKYYT